MSATATKRSPVAKLRQHLAELRRAEEAVRAHDERFMDWLYERRPDAPAPTAADDAVRQQLADAARTARIVVIASLEVFIENDELRDA